MKQIDVTIEGLSPGLMMSSLSGYGADVPDEVRERGIKDLKGWYEIEPDQAKAWQAESKTYRSKTGSGVFVIPCHVLSAAFNAACSGFKVKIGGKNMAANRVFPSVLSIEPYEIDILGKDDGKPRKEWSRLETMFVRIPPRTGARVPSTWAIVDDWKADLQIMAENNCTDEHLKTARLIFEHAGIYQGIMDGRPSLKRFNYGRWKVTNWSVASNKMSEAAD